MVVGVSYIAVVNPRVASSSGLSPNACKIAAAVRIPEEGFDSDCETIVRTAPKVRTIVFR